MWIQGIKGKNKASLQRDLAQRDETVTCYRLKYVFHSALSEVQNTAQAYIIGRHPRYKFWAFPHTKPVAVNKGLDLSEPVCPSMQW